ncbi:MAG: Heavy-metal resistance [Deltaproteobacteria bacterium]|nr:Heavy-metal resistance [Deltaproteobacteria bacterium]
MQSSKRNTIIVALLAVVVLAGISAAVQAAPGRGDGAHHRPGHFMRIIDFLLDLDLTADQKNDLQAIFTETQDTIKPLLGDMHEMRSAMDETFLGEEIDVAKASSQIEEMSRLKAQITTAGLTAMLQAAQVLTPEQRQTIIDARNEWKSRFTRLRNMMLSLFGESAVE